jgi:hypothetical protein
LQTVADHVYVGDRTSLPDPGTTANPKINYVKKDAGGNGDLTISGSFSGAGILIVEGDLVFGGNSSFAGVILVVGNGRYQQNGGGSGQYEGAVLVANTTTCSTTGNLGSPSYQVNGGGNNGIQFNSNLGSPPGGLFPLQLLSLN